MIKIDQFCYGCTACMAICARKAITMKTDKEGFWNPAINQELCSECGMCTKVCPKEHSSPTVGESIEVIALQHRDDDIRNKSTSGGAFEILSQLILEKYGVVYGVVHDENMVVKHQRAENRSDCELMHGSKYVQSNVGDSFYNVGLDLLNKKYVLFTGTPCQVDGLLNYLEIKKIPMDKLFTCQIICHGVPSPKIWKDHINFIQNYRKKKILKYIHRPKDYGWHEHNEKIIYDDGSSESQSKLSQNFKDLFYLGYSMKECCFTCPYPGKKGRADFNIGDFWGVEHILPEFDDNQGTSIVLINTEKGMKLIQNISQICSLHKVEFNEAFMYNHKSSSKKPKDYSAFWNDYHNGYEYVIKKYAKYKYPDIIVYRIKKIIRRFLVKYHFIGY